MFEGITKKRKNRAFNYAGWGLLAIVCGIFIFTGYSPNLDFAGNGSAVADVNGELITFSEFSRFYERAQEQTEGKKLNSEDRQKLKRQVVENLVNRALIIQAAKKQGIAVSPKEMADYLMQIPQFQENGKFSLLRYKQLLKGQGMSEARFEEKIAEDLLLQKMNAFYMRSAKEDKFLQTQEDLLAQVKMNVQFVAKSKSDVVSDSEIADTDISKFIKDNGAKVDAYYKDHPKDFTQEEQVEAQHILVKTSETVKDDQALAKIKKIFAETTVANFAAQAKKYSEDPGSKERGGELGLFGRGRMAPEFEEVAFTLDAGKVSAPFKTPFGYHIMKVSKKTAKKTQTLEEAKPLIARKLLKEEKMASAVKDLKAVLAQGPEAVQKMMEQKGWTWDETGPFSISDMSIPKLGENDQVLDAALSLNEKNPIYKDVIERNGAIYLVKLKGIETSKETTKGPLNQADFLRQLMGQQKSYELFQNWLDHLKKNASININNQALSTM